MSQYNQGASEVNAGQVPLFASSWVALFILIRRYLSKDDTDGIAPESSPKAESGRTTQ